MNPSSYSETALLDFLQRGQSDINPLLSSYFPEEDVAIPLYQAVRYSLFAGGKYLRSNLCLAACASVGGMREAALPFAAALELVHTYSLVHDDLPAMDNDDLRRGRPTNHKVYGEATAILVGDALLTEAFTLIAQKGVASGVAPETVIKAICELGEGAGLNGMVLGQFLDMLSEKKITMNEKEMAIVHQNKTGALIVAAVRIGAMVGNATPEQMLHLTEYAKRIGLAFQIADDILDVSGEEKELGKKVGQDQAQKKWTYPRLIGLEKSIDLANQLSEEAIDALDGLGENADHLRWIACFAVKRKK
ncbi:MAG: polyprenyl synthetase family protein [Nitrospirota bacterium]